MKQRSHPKSELGQHRRQFVDTFSGLALLRETWGGTRKRGEQVPGG